MADKRVRSHLEAAVQAVSNECFEVVTTNVVTKPPQVNKRWARHVEFKCEIVAVLEQVAEELFCVRREI